MAKNLYISDIAEAQPWSQKMGQVQVLQANGKPKAVKVNLKSENPKRKLAKKMK